MRFLLISLCFCFAASAMAQDESVAPEAPDPSAEPSVAPEAAEPAPKVDAASDTSLELADDLSWDEADEGGLSIVFTGSEDVDPYSRFVLKEDKRLVGVFPTPLKIVWPDARFVLDARSAVIWLTPLEAQTTAEDALATGIGDVEVYAEGHLRMRYGPPTGATILRATKLYLRFQRTPSGGYSLTGVLSDVRAHTSPAGIEHVTQNAEGFKNAGFDDIGNRGDGEGTTEDGDSGSPRVSSDTAKREADDLATPGEYEIKGLPHEKGDRVFLRADFMVIGELTSEGDGPKQFELDQAVVSGSSLALPNYSFASPQLRVNLSPTRNTVTMVRPALRLRTFELAVLPTDEYIYDLDSEFPVTRFELSRSQAKGLSLRTKIDIITAYDFFWDPEPPFRPFKLSPIFDSFEKRGVGLGLEFEYGGIRPFGTGHHSEWGAYYIQDRGDNRPVARSLGYTPLVSHHRGRFRGFMRGRYDSGFQWDFQANYESDRTFIREFFPEEFRDNLNPYTFAHVRKDHKLRAFYARAQTRLRTFADVVELLPVVGMATFREPIGPSALGVLATAQVEGGAYRIRTADGSSEYDKFDTGRVDSRFELYRPFDFGFILIEPMAGVRGTFSTHRVENGRATNVLYDERDGFVAPQNIKIRDDTTGRVLAVTGMNVQTNFVWTNANFSLPFFDMEGVRHIVTPSVRWENIMGPRDRQYEFVQLDEVDALGPQQRILLGLRERMQTRRVRLARDGGGWETVDFLDVIAELEVFPNRYRDNEGHYLGNLEIDGTVRPFRQLALRMGSFFDMDNRDWQRGFAALAYTYRASEFRATYRGLRSSHGVLGLSAATPVGDTYIVQASQEYDAKLGRIRDTRVEISRWVLESMLFNFTTKYDAINRDWTFGISLSGSFTPPNAGRALSD